MNYGQTNYVDVDGKYLYECLQKYQDKGGMSKERLSYKFGRSKGYVCGIVRYARADADVLASICRIIGADYKLTTARKVAFYPKKNSVVSIMPEEPKAFIKPKNDIRRMLYDIADKQQAISTLLVEVLKEMNNGGKSNV